jgi:hypothetical protein
LEGNINGLSGEFRGKLEGLSGEFRGLSGEFRGLNHKLVMYAGLFGSGFSVLLFLGKIVYDKYAVCLKFDLIIHFRK